MCGGAPQSVVRWSEVRQMGRCWPGVLGCSAWGDSPWAASVCEKPLECPNRNSV